MPPGPPTLPEGGQTLVYHTVEGHDVKLDFYLPPSLTGSLPVVIHWHGGGMTAGSRRGDFPRWLYDSCQKKGYIFISPDYRLCHPCTTLDQIEDAKALLQFLVSDKFKAALPADVSVDAKCIAVAGSSAGAYQARAACVYGTPKPAVLMTAYGLGGDLLLDHWTHPRPPTTLAQMVDLSKVPKLLADRSVVSQDEATGTLPITERFALTVRWEIDGTMLNGLFGQQGLAEKLRAVPYAQREAPIPDELKPGFLEFFVNENYPPSVFVHGTADEVVLDVESVRHHEQLKKLGIKTELLLVDGAHHGLVARNEDGLFGLIPDAVTAYAKSFDFIVEVLERV
ncbi:putative Alpha/Beta hydrolase protein [Seiridium cardinale]|uniref:Alpha/Beta hydrolase protein n=1 Tax=Seiridium cardinale TaxID=138064 RepID=A0ABR2XGZ7_9PEZI